MAERTVDIDLVSGSVQITSDEKALSEKNARRIKLREVYDRGVVGDRLHIELPNDVVGQWVPSDKLAIHRMESLGYSIDREHAKNSKLHDKGDDAAHVGDVVFMVASRETREMIDEIKAERYEALNNPQRKQREESNFEAQNKSLSNVGINTINESKTHLVKKQEIQSILSK